MFPLSNFVYLYMLKFVYSMSIETTDDCGQDPYETGCLVETFPGLNKDYCIYIQYPLNCCWF